MHVITGGATTATDLGNGLATLHQITDLHGIALVVRIERDVAIGMADFHGIAVTTLLPGEGHHTGRHRDYIATRLGGEVDALVNTGATAQGVHTTTKG